MMSERAEWMAACSCHYCSLVQTSAEDACDTVRHTTKTCSRGDMAPRAYSVCRERQQLARPFGQLFLARLGLLELPVCLEEELPTDEQLCQRLDLVLLTQRCETVSLRKVDEAAMKACSGNHASCCRQTGS